MGLECLFGMEMHSGTTLRVCTIALNYRPKNGKFYGMYILPQLKCK
jgi:hypothetical protein